MRLNPQFPTNEIVTEGRTGQSRDRVSLNPQFPTNEIVTIAIYPYEGWGGSPHVV